MTREELEAADAAEVLRLEAERMHPMPPDPVALDELFSRLLNLISAECRRAGYLPRRRA
jgi:hypothetical protein